jgi:glycosyltransferase involved in cell wall biosynthesis
MRERPSNATTTTSSPTGRVLMQRLATVAPFIIESEPERERLIDRGPGPLLAEIAERVRDADRADLVWLLLAVFLARFPPPDQVRMVRRELRTAEPGTAFDVILRAGARAPVGWADLETDVEIADRAVVVDVDFCAKYQHNTGIQRVVRETVSRWDGDAREMTLVAWTRTASSMRSLAASERSRVIAWDGSGAIASSGPPRDPEGYRIVVPFRSSVILAEVPSEAHCEPLASLAELSGNRVGVIAYDMIPVVSPNTVPIAETERFVSYLSLVKHVDRVAAISDTTAAEFAGFASALPAQGLPAPEVFALSLPSDVPSSTGEAASFGGVGERIVLCVGSQEPRKNHEAVLHASETLWREGHEFTLVFIGGGSTLNMQRFDARVDALRVKKRSVKVLRGVSDATLLAAYRRARFTIFPSIHEGYGLPVAESLAMGTPAITTRYGSTAEIAQDGGCLLVDPRDDDDIVRAMRSLLEDDALLERLRGEIAARPLNSWDSYAADLWRDLVEPLEARRG